MKTMRTLLWCSALAVGLSFGAAGIAYAKKPPPANANKEKPAPKEGEPCATNDECIRSGPFECIDGKCGRRPEKPMPPQPVPPT